MIKHTPGPWKTQEYGYCHVGKNIVTENETIAKSTFDGNADLITIAPSTPHECDDPRCPGNINRQKLEMFDELIGRLTVYCYSCAYVKNGCNQQETCITNSLIERARALQEAVK